MFILSRVNTMNVHCLEQSLLFSCPAAAVWTLRTYRTILHPPVHNNETVQICRNKNIFYRLAYSKIYLTKFISQSFSFLLENYVNYLDRDLLVESVKPHKFILLLLSQLEMYSSEFFVLFIHTKIQS